MDTFTVPAAPRLLTCVVTLLLLVGCGGTPTAQDTASPPTAGTANQTTGDPGTAQRSTTPDGPTTETFDDPETEDPEVTEEAEGGKVGVQIELPGLPIGGNAPADEADPTWRCAEVNWTGFPESPPPEVNLQLTSLGASPAGVYELIDGGCGGLGPCLNRVGALTGGGRCAVAVRQVAASPDTSGELFVGEGSISCASGHEEICERFLTDLAQNSELATIAWSDALTEWPSPDAPTTGADEGSTGATGTGDETGTTVAP